MRPKAALGTMKTRRGQIPRGPSEKRLSYIPTEQAGRYDDARLFHKLLFVNHTGLDVKLCPSNKRSLKRRTKDADMPKIDSEDQAKSDVIEILCDN